MTYCDPADIREVGTQITATSSPTPATDAVLRTIIERASRMFDLACGVEPGYFESATYPVWKSLHVYAVGDIVTPTTANAHKYRVTTAGTSGASEPVWPTSAAATVANGSVTFTENGADVVATNKTVYGDNRQYLRLPPYVPGSLNATLTYPDGYTALDFVERDGYLIQTSTDGVTAPFLFYGSGWYGGAPIIVSAIWGFDGTPEDVKAAVTELAINLWRETDPAGVKLVNIEGQILREGLPPRVKEIAKRYRMKGVAFV